METGYILWLLCFAFCYHAALQLLQLYGAFTICEFDAKFINFFSLAYLVNGSPIHKIFCIENFSLQEEQISKILQDKEIKNMLYINTRILYN